MVTDSEYFGLFVTKPELAYQRLKKNLTRGASNVKLCKALLDGAEPLFDLILILKVSASGSFYFPKNFKANDKNTAGERPESPSVDDPRLASRWPVAMAGSMSDILIIRRVRFFWPETPSSHSRPG
jgi:hypothetical protein